MENEEDRREAAKRLAQEMGIGSCDLSQNRDCEHEFDAVLLFPPTNGAQGKVMYYCKFCTGQYFRRVS